MDCHHTVEDALAQAWYLLGILTESSLYCVVLLDYALTLPRIDFFNNVFLR